MRGETILEHASVRSFTFIDQKDYNFCEDLHLNWYNQNINSFSIEGKHQGDISCLFAFTTTEDISIFFTSYSKYLSTNEKTYAKSIKNMFPLPLVAENTEKALKKTLQLFTTHNYIDHDTYFHDNVYLNVVLLQRNDGKTKQSKSKYKAKKRFIDYTTFDSHNESLYYLHLKDLLTKGLILSFEMQPRFLLQESFSKNNIIFPKLEYIADFKVINTDHTIDIIDVKGVQTTEFKIKQKLFEYRYKELHIKLLKYSQRTGWNEINSNKPTSSSNSYFIRKRRK
ncbi:DUF1064 domain-containing protein [Bacillus bombysepticus]|uniref:DUF1064 domain-containing protein n=1 Tax=Bacillus bombysepticus TaxID=658666 RepID=UPI00301B3193